MGIGSNQGVDCQGGSGWRRAIGQGGLHGREAALGRQQPDDQGQQGQADGPDAEGKVLPVAEPASQQGRRPPGPRCRRRREFAAM